MQTNMTTADTMTDKQINRAIAEVCGIAGKDEHGPIYNTRQKATVNEQLTVQEATTEEFLVDEKEVQASHRRHWNDTY
jgi:type IV secretory pathway TraG/TraD family ATPase VirD4